MNAPTRGAKLVKPIQMLMTFEAETWSMWYTRIRYTMKFASSPNDASLSNVSFPALRFKALE